MNRLIFISCIFFTGIFVGAEELGPPNEWFQCKVDSDCIEIEFYCAGGIVNIAFAKEAQKYYANLNARSKCFNPPLTESEKKIPYKVFCEKKKCQVQGKNPKGPGFS